MTMTGLRAGQAKILDMRRRDEQATCDGHTALDGFRAHCMHRKRRDYQCRNAQCAEKWYAQMPMTTIAHAQREYGRWHHHHQNQLMKSAVIDHGEAEYREQGDDQRQRQAVHEAQSRQRYCGFV